MYSAEAILLPLQRLQQKHDEIAHRDILSFNLQKRLKHMVLHFYKYAGKVEAARAAGDLELLRHTLLDVFIICMASANAMNISLGAKVTAISETDDLDGLTSALAQQVCSTDLYTEALKPLLLIGGRMAKVIESADHMEEGNPRSDMAALVPELAIAVISVLGHLDASLELDLKKRLLAVEQRSILWRATEMRSE